MPFAGGTAFEVKIQASRQRARTDCSAEFAPGDAQVNARLTQFVGDEINQTEIDLHGHVISFYSSDAWPELWVPARCDRSTRHSQNSEFPTEGFVSGNP